MMNPRFSLPGPEFGPFLYSSVGEQRNGMLLSVLSALARLNLDPWQEAAELTVLPVEIARKRLASIIEGSPGMVEQLDGGKTADRLMMLLPKQTPSDATKGPAAQDRQRPAKSLFGFWMIVMGLMICLQIISASLQPPASSAGPTVPTAKTVSRPTALPASSTK